jgi:hypothetical protein
MGVQVYHNFGGPWTLFFGVCYQPLFCLLPQLEKKKMNKIISVKPAPKSTKSSKVSTKPKAKPAKGGKCAPLPKAKTKPTEKKPAAQAVKHESMKHLIKQMSFESASALLEELQWLSDFVEDHAELAVVSSSWRAHLIPRKMPYRHSHRVGFIIMRRNDLRKSYNYLEALADSLELK